MFVVSIWMPWTKGERMKQTLKQILTGFMIAGDFFFMIVAIILMNSSEFTLGILMLIFLIIDTVLSFDYIATLHKQKQVINDQETEEQIAYIRNQAKLDELQRKQDALDDAMAEEIRKHDVEDIADLLSQHAQQQTQQAKK